MVQESSGEIPHKPSGDRDLPEKLIREETHALSLSLALLMKGNMEPSSWKKRIVDMLNNQHEAISNVDANMGYDYLAQLLGIDTEKPPTQSA